MERKYTYPHRVLYSVPVTEYFRVPYYFTSPPMFYDREDDDSRYFSHLQSGFMRERATAFQQEIPVTFVEGESIYRTLDGITREEIGRVEPKVAIPIRSIKIW